MAIIANTKSWYNHTIGEVGVLFNLDDEDTLDVSTGKVDFQAPPSGWLYYGLTDQDTKLTTDVATFESKGGIPEYIIRTFVVGTEGSITGNFREADLAIHDLIAGDGTVLNVGLGTADALTTVTKATKTVVAADTHAAQYIVGNQIVHGVLSGDCASSMNTARIKSKTVGGGFVTLVLEDWFALADPVAAEYINSSTYGIAKIASPEVRTIQTLLVFESNDGIQFLYYFPKCEFKPNMSPTFSSINEVFTLPFEVRLKGVGADWNGDFTETDTVLGFYYELHERFTS